MQALNYYKTVKKGYSNPILQFEEIPDNAKQHRGVTMYQGFYIYKGVIIAHLVRSSKGWIDGFFDGDGLESYFNVARPRHALTEGLKLLAKQ